MRKCVEGLCERWGQFTGGLHSPCSVTSSLLLYDLQCDVIARGVWLLKLRRLPKLLLSLLYPHTARKGEWGEGRKRMPVRYFHTWLYVISGMGLGLGLLLKYSSMTILRLPSIRAPFIIGMILCTFPKSVSRAQSIQLEGPNAICYLLYFNS